MPLSAGLFWLLPCGLKLDVNLLLTDDFDDETLFLADDID